MKGKAWIMPVVIFLVSIVAGMFIGRKFGDKIPLLNKIQP